MKTTLITMRMRLEYLRKLYQIEHKERISFPQFMECLFSKLEQEIRSGTSQINKYHKEGEGDKLPLSNNTEEFKYEYDR